MCYLCETIFHMFIGSFNQKIIFEVLKEQEYSDIFNNDSYLMMYAIEKSKTTEFLSYYALSKVHLHKNKSYFRIIQLLSGDVNLNPGLNADVVMYSLFLMRVFLMMNLRFFPVVMMET